MIPKIIHYCLFGKNPLPQSAKKCIASWKKYFPDYEIIQWNEENYDVNKIQYIKEAYQAKKYAFVSDFARFDILYQHGGLYFDTDVQVIKSFDKILDNGSFLGCEIDPSGTDGIQVSPGLGIGAEPNLPIFKNIIDYYQTQSFLMPDGAFNQETVVKKTTRILIENGLENIKGIQKIGGITIYPKEYFNPLNNNTGKLDISENTYSIHWYTMTWMSKKEKIRSKITRIFHRIFGEDCFSIIKKK